MVKYNCQVKQVRQDQNSTGKEYQYVEDKSDSST